MYITNVLDLNKPSKILTLNALHEQSKGCVVGSTITCVPYDFIIVLQVTLVHVLTVNIHDNVC